MSLEEGGKVRKVCGWSEVARWERWENSVVEIWGRWEGSEQRRWDGI